MLSIVKDEEKQSCVVYKIPCSCGKVYLGETRGRLYNNINDIMQIHLKSATNRNLRAHTKANKQ